MTSRALLLTLSLFCIACSDLDTTYGSRQGTSINGVRVLHDTLAERTQLHEAWLLSPKTEATDLLFYFAKDNALPDVDAGDWLVNWLEAGESPRQAVLIVRDGNVARALCEKWADEMRGAGKPDEAERLLARAESEPPDHVAAPDPPSETDLFVMVTRETAPVTRLEGLGLAVAPTLLTLGAWLDPEDDGDVLLTADGLPFIVSWPIGEQGRLLVVANATGLVDGALPDPNARALLNALLTEVLRFHGDRPPEAIWLNALRVRDADPPEQNMLRYLWTPPFSWPLWHLLALLAVVVLARAAWLGRQERRKSLEVARFARHVDALAGLMAQAAARDPAVVQDAAAAIAATAGHPPPPADVTTADDAVAWLAQTPAAAPADSPTGDADA